MYIISVMLFTFSTRDFGHPKFFKSQFGHPVMKIMAKSLCIGIASYKKGTGVFFPLMLKALFGNCLLE